MHLKALQRVCVPASRLVVKAAASSLLVSLQSIIVAHDADLQSLEQLQQAIFFFSYARHEPSLVS